MKENVISELNALLVPIETVNLNASNTRKHGDANIDHLKRSLTQYGQRKPIVVQKKGMVVRAGNGMLQAALALGWKKIAAVVIDENSTDATGYEIMDNRSAETSEWDMDVLMQELKALQAEEFDLSLTGYDESELEELLSDAPMPGSLSDLSGYGEKDCETVSFVVHVGEGAEIKARINEIAKTNPETNEIAPCSFVFSVLFAAYDERHSRS